mgnify:CR=1 FL=1
MRIENDLKLDFNSVLIRPKRSTLNSRKEVSLEREFKFKNGGTFVGVPIIAANMDTVGTMKMAEAFYKHKMPVALHKFYQIEQLVNFFKKIESVYSFYTLGTSDDDLEKFDKVYTTLKEYHKQVMNGQGGADHIHCLNKVCIDIANGYSEHFNNFIKRFRAKYPELTIMAGNVVTGEMTEELILSGADIVKIGIGPGSVCTTRKKTGVGYPQLSAIIECADAAHGLGAMICGDGGITNSGDVAKAFGAGADFIMCGGMFAGHDECEGEIEGKTRKLKKGVKISENIVDPRTYAVYTNFKIMVEGEGMKSYSIKNEDATSFYSSPSPFDLEEMINILPDYFIETTVPKDAKMKFYGMSSEDAMNKHYNGKANYRASEGKTVYVDYKGPVENTVIDILGGLRSACTYTGAKSLKQLSKCTTFIRVSQQLNEVFGKS